jgi:hypothetical protein
VSLNCTESLRPPMLIRLTLPSLLETSSGQSWEGSSRTQLPCTHPYSLNTPSGPDTHTSFQILLLAYCKCLLSFSRSSFSKRPTPGYKSPQAWDYRSYRS